VLGYVHDRYAGNLANTSFQIFITCSHDVTLVLQTKNIRTVAANQLHI